MFNIMLDPLPAMWEGFPIDSDFRIGIQISQIFEDKELMDAEKFSAAAELLFTGIMPYPEEQAEAIQWVLSDWNHDNVPKSKNAVRVMDYDIDQWRIYSAFKHNYGIDLNAAEMHYWQFMGLLTTLEECAFTHVIELRAKKVTGKMSNEQKAAIMKAKKMYALEQPEQNVSDEVKEKNLEAIKTFEEMRKAKP